MRFFQRWAIATSLFVSFKLAATPIKSPMVFQAKKGDQVITLIGTIHHSVPLDSLPRCVKGAVEQADQLLVESLDEDLYVKFSAKGESNKWHLSLDKTQRAQLERILKRTADKGWIRPKADPKKILEKISTTDLQKILIHYYPRAIADMDSEIIKAYTAAQGRQPVTLDTEESKTWTAKALKKDEEKQKWDAIRAGRSYQTASKETWDSWLDKKLAKYSNPTYPYNDPFFKSYRKGNPHKFVHANPLGPEFYERAIRKRNFLWPRFISPAIYGKKRPVIAVGAAHLTHGESSLLHWLQKYKYEVYQVDQNCQKKQDYTVIHLPEKAPQRGFPGPGSIR